MKRTFNTVDQSGNVNDHPNKKTMRKIITFPGNEKPFAIDQDDFFVITKALYRVEMDANSSFGGMLEKVIGTREEDDEKRVCSLDLNEAKNLSELPNEIGNLSSLVKLDLSGSNIESLPPSVGNLKNLQALSLCNTQNLVELPNEIGNVSSLVELDLDESNIKSLPPSVGNLKNLQALSLCRTNNLVELPNEIGNVSSLIKLDLDESNIKSLPPSVGNLKNLQALSLCRTNNLVELPNEIGNVSSLVKLDLRESNMESLPPSVGNLKNLQVLSLRNTKNLVELPNEIGNVSSLVKLDLGESNMESLPPSVGNLKNLQALSLCKTKNLVELPEAMGELVNLAALTLWNSSIRRLPDSLGNLENLTLLDLDGSGVKAIPSNFQKLASLKYLHVGDADVSGPFLMKLTKCCKFLGCLGVKEMYLGDDLKSKLGLALAHNRAKSQMMDLASDKKIVQVIPKLWPLVLNDATKTFREYINVPEIYTSQSVKFCDYTPPCNISKVDASYHLLASDYGRESFLVLLIHRNAEKAHG